jgi:carbonic anhydrase
MPLGVTGVIRGAGRNATIRAEQTVQLIMIPKMIYLKYWHHPYTLASFLAHIHTNPTTEQSAATNE